MTLLIAIVAMIYATSKARHIQTVNGQTISTYEIDGENRTPDSALNLNDRDFRIAFKFGSNWPPFESLHDPRYVRLFARTQTTDGVTGWEKIIPHHECTDEDFAQFYPIVTE